jgi:hypothetical protein
MSGRCKTPKLSFPIPDGRERQVVADSTQSLIAILRRLVILQLPFGVEGHL